MEQTVQIHCVGEMARHARNHISLLMAAALVASTLFGPSNAPAATANFEILVPSEQIQVTSPRGGLIHGPDGALYGVGSQGGSLNAGGIFRISPEGEYKTVASFAGNKEGGLAGSAPNVPLTKGNDGRLYGTTSGSSGGTAFYVTTGENATATHFSTFADAGIPASAASALVEARDGRLYGINSTTVFRVTPGATPTLENVATFSSTTHNSPHPLTPGPDGKLYGVNRAGNGTVIAVTPGDTVTAEVLGTFTGRSGLLPGETPTGKLLRASDGRLYGMTSEGGASDCGTLFVVTPGTPATVTSFASFTGGGVVPGDEPVGSLVEGADGRLYGATAWGGLSYAGTIFRVHPGATPSVETVTSFVGNSSNPGLRGGMPTFGLFSNADGNLYGICNSYLTGLATIYRVSPEDTARVQHLTDFDTAVSPFSPLLPDPSGKLYGTAFGANHSIYVVDPDAAEPVSIITKLTFPRQRFENATLAKGKDGALYSFARGGVLFRITADGNYEELETADFGRSKPNLPLVMGRDGRFYGTSEEERTYGSVFVVDLDTRPRIRRIKYFSGGGDPTPTHIPGRNPSAALVEAPDGRLYGLTAGVYRSPTAFVITPGVGPQVDHIGALASQNVGQNAEKMLTLGSDGRLYSTIYTGGSAGLGSVFRITPGSSPSIQTLASFTGISGALPGSRPYASLQSSPDGYLYGSTTGGGKSNAGTLFRIKPADQPVISSLVSFTGASGDLPGVSPWEAPTLASDGNLYGTTGGNDGDQRGTIYRVTPGDEPSVTHLTTLTGVAGDFPGNQITNPLVEGADRMIYGVAEEGGQYNQGVLFRFSLAPEPVFETLIHFGSGVTGIDPDSHLLRLPNGTFYGVTNSSIFRVRFDTPPLFLDINEPVTTVSGATFASVVYPSESMTDVRLDYGTSEQFGLSQSFPEIGAGTLEQRLNLSISGLQPHTTYYYRVVAENAFGTVTSETRSLTTANSVPVAVDDSILSSGQSALLDVALNDTDADGDSLAISQVFQPALGSVAFDGTTVTYTPGAGYLGRDSFSYTISDGFGGSATAQVRIYSDQVLSRSLLASNASVPGVSGTLKRLDSFGFTGTDDLPFAGIATVAGPGKRKGQAVIGGEPATLVLATGSELDALPGVFVSGIRSLAGHALIATLQCGKAGVSGKNDLAILALESDSLRLVARKGDEAPGISGATFASFVSVDWGMGAVFIAKVKGAGITAKNDTGLWAETAAGLRLICREREDVLVGENQKRVKSVMAHLAASKGPTFARACGPDGRVLYRVTFTDRTHAVLRFDCNDPDAGSSVLAFSGGLVPNLGEMVYADLGVPTVGLDGAVAFSAAVRSANAGGSSKVRGIVVDGEFHTGALVPTSDPVAGDLGQAAVLSKLIGVTPKARAAIAVVNGDALEVLAAVGDEAPGASGARFQRFQQLSMLPDRGAVFSALLAQKKGVTAKNRNGLWAQDSEGKLTLILRSGDSLTVDGVPQKIESFRLMPPAAAADEFGSDGKLLCVVQFKGGVQRLMQFRVP